MSIYCAVCDDSKQYAVEVKGKLCSIFRKKELFADVSIFHSGQTLLFHILEGKHYDLILLDIEMPGMNGMETAKEINKILPDCTIVFLTSYVKYAIDAFELPVFRYIPKNEIDQRLESTIDAALDILELNSKKFYTIVKHGYATKIYYQNINYVIKDGKYVLFKCRDGTETKDRKALQAVFSELDSKEFIYIDRSCFVNIVNILKVKNKEVLLKDGTVLQVSRSNWQKVITYISEYWSDIL